MHGIYFHYYVFIRDHFDINAWFKNDPQAVERIWIHASLHLDDDHDAAFVTGIAPTVCSLLDITCEIKILS